MNIENTRRLLGALDFGRLFIEELGWSQPTLRRPLVAEVQGAVFRQRMVAQLAGAAVFVIWQEPKAGASPALPERALRDAVERDIAKQFRENLCIFIDREREPTQSFWLWAKRGRDAEGKPKRWVREHSYFRGQPADLFISKLHALFFELADVAEGSNLTVVKVAQRLQAALDVERVTKQFFKDYQAQHAEFLSLIEGLDNERDRRWYASVLLNRLMFVWFLQKKRFLDHDPRRGHGNLDYLTDKLAQSKAAGPDRFYKVFLKALFFDAFAKPEVDRLAETRALCGAIPYLNGGLFLEHPLELDELKRLRIGISLHVPDRAFENLFALFARYSWSLDDTPGGDADEINPDVLGYIFEKYINQKAFGAYYTRPEITGYLAERSIHQLILERVHQPALPELGLPEVKFDSVPELLARMDARTALRLVNEVLPSITVLDPAVGSGAFLVAALKCLINVYYAVVGRAELGAGAELQAWLRHIQASHPSVGYYIKRRIVTDNLYGVDIMEEASDIAKLRLFLAMVSSVRKVEDLEPLPNIDFNILAGNSLVGLMRVDEHEFDAKYRHGDLFRKSFRELLDEKNRKLATYRAAADTLGSSTDLRALRDDIDAAMAEANGVMNELLQDQFAERGIKFEQATWDAANGKLGKPKKRKVEFADVAAQRPLHWGYVFDDIVQQRGGFDIVLANPPWEVFKPQAKEFFGDHSDLVSKNKMTIKEFEDERDKLLKDKVVREAWLAYEDRFPHMNQFFRLAPEYCHQFATVDGRKVGSDLNLYKLFLERCFTLLRPGGHCGIVIPSGLYKDMGAAGLRHMLFDEASVDSVIALSNEKRIFEGVHHAQGLLFLTFRKGGRTETLVATFRINPREAVAPEEFARFVEDSDNFVRIPVRLIRECAPESISVPEFRSQTDLNVASKLRNFPLLGADSWGLVLRRELHMTDDAPLYRTACARGLWPLWEGKQFHQFDANYGVPRYWVDEAEGKAVLAAPRLNAIKKQLEARGITTPPRPEQVRLDCESFRLAFRDVTATTNERTVIACVLPPSRFCPHTVSMEQVYFDRVDDRGHESVARLSSAQRLYLVAVFNSFVFDWTLRNRVTAHVSFFFIYNTPVPKLSAGDPHLELVVSRAARLSCRTTEFDLLAREVGLRGHRDGATDPTERARLRAEIDGLVAHLYGLSEDEFAHILATFPLVPDPAKVAARNAYRDVSKGLLQ